VLFDLYDSFCLTNETNRNHTFDLVLYQANRFQFAYLPHLLPMLVGEFNLKLVIITEANHALDLYKDRFKQAAYVATV
jgi:hypothetical protein